MAMDIVPYQITEFLRRKLRLDDFKADLIQVQATTIGFIDEFLTKTGFSDEREHKAVLGQVPISTLYAVTNLCQKFVQ